MLCLVLDLFGFILFGTICVSCTWVSIFFVRFGKSSAIISTNTFLVSFSLSLLSGAPIMCRLACFILIYRCHFVFFFFLKFVFLTAVLIGRFSLFCFPDHLFVFLWHLVCCSLLTELVFISAIELSNFDWFMFVVSSPFYSDQHFYW